MSKANLIINKLEVCGCGCHGSDPWHRSEYRRVVKTTPGSLEGTVIMPYSTKPVRVVRDTPNGIVWVVDRSSIVFDK